VETTKNGYNTNRNDKVLKRDYYAPEYNHDQYVSENPNIKSKLRYKVYFSKIKLRILIMIWLRLEVGKNR